MQNLHFLSAGFQFLAHNFIFFSTEFAFSRLAHNPEFLVKRMMGAKVEVLVGMDGLSVDQQV